MKNIRKELWADSFPSQVQEASDEPGVEHGKGDRGQDITGIVVTCVDASQCGESDEIPGPTEGGSPDQSGRHDSSGGVGHMGGGEGAAMLNFPFRNV